MPLKKWFDSAKEKSNSWVFFCAYMPLAKGKSKKAIASRFHELYADNKKSGKAKGAGGKPRSRAQIIAIALNATGKKKGKK